MVVSRETTYKTGKEFLDFLSSNKPFSFNLDQEIGLLPFFLSCCPGSVLVVEDDLFWSVFNSLYRLNIPFFSVVTNVKSSSPRGFVSPLISAVSSFSLYEKEVARVVLTNHSCYYGESDYAFESRSCVVNKNIQYDDLLLDIEHAGMVRVSTVISQGTFSRRGCVLDFFPLESSFPIRVDFSFERARIYSFDVSSQITLKQMDRFVFIVSNSKTKRIKTKDILSKLTLISFSNGVLTRGSGAKILSLNPCKYDAWEFFSSSYSVSPFLHSVGFSFGSFAFIPSWFLGEKPPTAPSPPTTFLDSFDALVLGDLLVHEDFGVCSFDGLIEASDGDESSVLLLFADGRVSLPVSNMFLLSPFSGPADRSLLNYISKKGSWKRKIKSISNSVNFFVKTLLDQHIKRTTLSKTRRPIDASLLSQFVSSFKHNDTEDQLLAFKDVINDLSSPLPMDRLLCADVGFGKTEIAMRASFVSILGSGRVLVLAPTTILCYQLYESFVSRLEPFAVNVGMVSRLTKKNMVGDLVNKFNSGMVDVLVCTHRVFSCLSDINRVDLLVVDEEHRFGVKQKEGFLSRFPEIDILLMSATPIPRSLQSALSGIKTISTISTPPINRLPIQTSVSFFDVDMILQNIKYEVDRGGQVYFLHNNIHSLERVKKIISRGLQGVSVKTIHGKMSAIEIEKTINSFSSGHFSVLVSTTIIENGLDIPNVNTIIINNAHLFGLSQLHQIRGRVGRHSRQAFAYLLIPRALKLNTPSKRRLKAIEKNVSLGSGYNISTKDLEIRGGGSVFGYNQSGGSVIGFELYNKILNKALSDILLSDQALVENISVHVFQDEACFPQDYIEEDGLRMSLYKSLLQLSSFDLINEFKASLVDRYGVYSPLVENLFLSQELRVLCVSVGVCSVSVDSSFIKIVFIPNTKNENISSFILWFDSFFKEKKMSFSFKPGAENRLILCVENIVKKKDIYVFLKHLLNKFKDTF